MKYVKNKTKDFLNKYNVNKNNLYVVLDYDRTITLSNGSDSWDAVAEEKIVGPEIKKEMEELYKKYRPIELSYDISIEEKEKAMMDWDVKCLNLFYKYGINKSLMLKSIRNSNTIFREGTKEFLEYLYKENIPAIILSGGIGNAINVLLEENNMLFNNITIISNYIDFEDDGKIKKINNNDIIHTLNKTVDKHLTKELKEKIINRNNVILVGDLIEDSNMVKDDENNNVLKIVFLDDEIEKDIEQYKNEFDVVLTKKDASFKEILKVIKTKGTF